MRKAYRLDVSYTVRFKADNADAASRIASHVQDRQLRAARESAHPMGAVQPVTQPRSYALSIDAEKPRVLKRWSGRDAEWQEIGDVIGLTVGFACTALGAAMQSGWGTLLGAAVLAISFRKVIRQNAAG